MTSLRPTTARIYSDYDRIVKQVETWVQLRNPRIGGCDETQVRGRVTQRIVELTSDGYASQRASSVHELCASDSGHFTVNGIRVCTQTGRVAISLHQYFLHMMVFAATWLQLLGVLAAAFFRRAPSQILPATLLLDTPSGCETSDAAFVKFCREGSISVLSAATRIVIAAKEPEVRVDRERFKYARQPLHLQIKELVPRSLRLQLLLRHLLTPFIYLSALVRCNLSILASRDLSSTEVMRLLDRRGCIEAFVITTSAFATQPLWMKGLKGQRCKLHMLWYSQNFIPKMYAGDTQRPNLPPARFMRVDEHWVWTPGFRNYLLELGQKSEVHVVGPILWYLPPTVVERTSSSADVLKVALFDITPLPDGTTAFGALKNYYSVATISKFVTDSLDCCEHIAAITGKQVLLLLKHKRAPKKGRHASAYLSFLEKLASTRPSFRIIEHDCNLFELLSDCQLSISVPYTSTVYVAAALAKPAIYYDSYAELTANYESNEFVRFAAGPLQLRSVIAACLGLTHLAESG